MSDSSNPLNHAFGKFVPGFDFLQGLASSAVKGAAQGMPQLPNPANWVAPTLSVEELDKRIEELKTVQFWLDQNAKALQATVTALEVQKMTLATLKGMNFNMGDVANAFKLKASETVANTVNSAFGKTSPIKAAVKKNTKSPTSPAAGGLVDPMQWWGSLTQQFGQIASDAMKDAGKKTAMDTSKHIAKAMTQTALNTAKTATHAATSTARSTTKSIATKSINSRANAQKSMKKPISKRA
jgi:hypothetical protein